MRSLLLAILLFALFVFFIVQTVPLVLERLAALKRSEPAAEVAVSIPVEPDNVGEKISYDVLMGSMRMGTATYEHYPPQQKNGQVLSHVVFKTQVFKFTDIENIYGDPRTFLPVIIERQVRAWPRLETITEIYDQQNHRLEIVKREGKRTTRVSFQKDGAIHNAILLPFYVRRTAEFRVGWQFRANLPTQDFSIRLGALEEVRVPYGKSLAYRFESVPSRFTIWISADEKKIPLKIQGASGIGYTLMMRSYSLEPPDRPRQAS